MFQYINSISLEDVMVECKIGASGPIRFLIDSGADVNVIGGRDWEQIKSDESDIKMIDHQQGRKLRSYATETPLSIHCAFRARVDVVHAAKPSVTADFIVVKEGRQSLLGRTTAGEMKLLQIGFEVNRCSAEKRVQHFPKMPGVKVKSSVDKTIPPERNAYYNVPAAYREAARLRLQEMEDLGIIERVVSAPEWISGMSAVPKGNSDFRLVVNMRGPNRAIKREYFRLPLMDEIRVKLHGSKFFSKLDLTNAYYHLELSKESRDLTTFLTENGMFRFTRLMFGVNAAPEIFQREMCRLLEEIPNVIIYIDDVLIYADSLEELRETTAKVMRILRNNNLTLNTTKCELDKTRIKFLGHELDADGFHVDEAKIKDVRQFRPPKTVSELRSFLGLASFLSPHLENYADLTSPLWAVANKNTWKWEAEQAAAFELTKERIVQCTVTLGYFSDEDKTILYTDASPNALGAVLVQESAGKPPPA